MPPKLSAENTCPILYISYTYIHQGRSRMADTVSRKQYTISGILVTVFGLGELSPQAKEVSCLWLLHPRLGNSERMSSVAVAAITEWNKESGMVDNAKTPRGLIAVSFDQRNHGTRLVNPVANESWKEGNERHAQDMFSIYRASMAKLRFGRYRQPLTRYVFSQMVLRETCRFSWTTSHLTSSPNPSTIFRIILSSECL